MSRLRLPVQPAGRGEGRLRAARDHAAALTGPGAAAAGPRDGAAAARCLPRATRRAPDPPPASDAFRDLASSIGG
jgi:hypothetical protein